MAVCPTAAPAPASATRPLKACSCVVCNPTPSTSGALFCSRRRGHATAVHLYGCFAAALLMWFAHSITSTTARLGHLVVQGGRGGDFYDGTTEGGAIDALQGGRLERTPDWDALIGPGSNLGNLGNMTCVCGCRARVEGSDFEHTTQVSCAFDQDHARHKPRSPTTCVIRDSYFYASDSPFAGTDKRLPLVVVVCAPEPGWEGMFVSRDKAMFWANHRAFGIDFDHVSEWRLANFPASEACRQPRGGMNSCDHGGPCSNITCRVPEAFTWNGAFAADSHNGWRAHDAYGVELASVPVAPQLAGATTAYIDSADCWFHGEMGNPWHCLATVTNWHHLTGIFRRYPHLLGGSVDEFNVDDAVLFALQGYDEFDHRLSGGTPLPGWHELTLAVGRFVGDFHDDDHRLRDALRGKNSAGAGTTVRLQGRLPSAVVNAPLSRSNLWSDDLFPPGQRNDVAADFRRGLERTVSEHLVRTLGGRHPLLVLLLDYPDHIRLIVPPDGGPRATVEVATDNASTALLDRLPRHIREEVMAWEDVQKHFGGEWKVRPLERIAFLIRRSGMPGGSTPITAPVKRECKRCLTNVGDIGMELASSLELWVVVVHLHKDIPAALQLYLWMSSSLIVGMHGGAWGSAVSMTSGQAAVEVLPRVMQLNASHIIVPTGAEYRCSRLVNEDRFLSGQGDVGEIVNLAREALLMAVAARAKLETTMQ